MKTVSKSTVPTPADSALGGGALSDGEHADHVHGAAPAHEVPPRPVLDHAGDLRRALAAPVRLASVLPGRAAARCGPALGDVLAVAQPLVSQHLRILKSAGVVAGERSGREVRYRLVDHHLSDIVLAAVAHAGEYSHDHEHEGGAPHER